MFWTSLSPARQCLLECLALGDSLATACQQSGLTPEYVRLWEQTDPAARALFAELRECRMLDIELHLEELVAESLDLSKRLIRREAPAAVREEAIRLMLRFSLDPNPIEWADHPVVLPPCLKEPVHR